MEAMNGRIAAGAAGMVSDMFSYSYTGYCWMSFKYHFVRCPEMKKKLSFVFVHGLAGWGSYDETYQKKPYWGMRGGDLMAYLKEKGYACYAASVSPVGSAWDRACELYAQLAGTRVDYGETHSREFRHERFGRDFSDKPLIPEWNEDTRLVPIGHSFGGATIRLFAQLLSNGDPAQLISSDGISPLFEGGMGKRIHSIVTLASPTNGTTAYDMTTDPLFDLAKVKVPWWSKALAKMMSKSLKVVPDGRDERDYASFDMYIDHAIQLNRRIETLPWVYYFSVSCSFTIKNKDGTCRPKRGMEAFLVMRSCLIGAYTGRTKGGIQIDDRWRKNDGLVNTVSAAYPIGAPHKKFDTDHIEPGIWNVFPVYDGDHMSLQGGYMHRHEIREFYLTMLQMIDALPKGTSAFRQ